MKVLPSIVALSIASSMFAPAVKADDVRISDREISCFDSDDGVEILGIPLSAVPIPVVGAAIQYGLKKPCQNWRRAVLVANCIRDYRANPRYAARAGVTCGGAVAVVNTSSATKPWGPREAFGSMNVTSN